MTTAFVQLAVEQCYACGVAFGMAADFQANRLSDGKNFYCPNGHCQHYTGKTDAQKLKDAEVRESALKDQLSAAIRDADATRVALLRDRQRFAKGVCPCCNRSFDNVRRHMASKHPDFDVTKVDRPDRAHAFKCSCGRSFDSLRGLRIHQGWNRADGWDEAEQSPYWAHLTRT